MKKTNSIEQSSHAHKLTEGEIKACITEGMEEFWGFLAILHKRLGSQLPHDVLNNIPRGLVRFEGVAKHAVRVALVAAIGEYLSWNTEDVSRFAAELLEDSNIHDLARVIHERIETYGDD